MKRLFKNIKGLVNVWDQPPVLVSGREMKELPVLENAWLAVEDDLIADFGMMSEWPGISDWRDLEVIDAEGKYIFPAWCDSHTHIIYAGSRESEFEDRIRGLTYEQIAAKGGGILNSAKLLHTESENDLYESAWKRLNEMMYQGTGAVEIKSGYGLTTESELKILRVIQRLKEQHPLTIRATFLGAHALPEIYKGIPDKYVDLIINEMLPAIASEKLADFIDVFCEKNYFSVAQMERILDAGQKFGLPPKVHVNQFNSIGAIDAAVKKNALSVDHLEVVTEADIRALCSSTVLPVALPCCSLFIGIPYTPARRIIDRGLPLALASDYNPGSSPTGNMNLVVSLACIQMQMTVSEAIQAATLNGAAAMALSNTHGSISPGKKANFFVTKEMPSVAFLPYSFGSVLVEEVYIGGEKR
ncbi:MAG: imidazolonepropionase [Crocinitomicaceae bacterium]|nr:imidazolonepropionase [Crocinitomicaceae bacterium]